MTEQEERDAHLRVVWNTLMFFAVESSYTMGERTGGVLQGCPRKPPPMPHEMAGYARRALESVLRYLGREPDAWMLDGAPAPQDVWRVVAPDGREWRSDRLLAAVAAAIEQTKLQFPAHGSGVPEAVNCPDCERQKQASLVQGGPLVCAQHGVAVLGGGEQ